MTAKTLQPCPPWCTVPREDHEEEVRRDGTTFHLAETIDSWALAYRNHPVRVVVDSFEVPGAPENSSGATINVGGELGRGSMDYAELEVNDARRLALALLRACEVIEPTATPLPATSTAGHPAWCTGHDRFDDGSDDWHRSPDLAAGGVQFFLSTGTRTGEPEVFVTDVPDEGIPLDQAESVALTLLAAVSAARSEGR